jgi:hypothetical protein
VLIATAPPLDRARAWRGNHTEAYLADIRSHDRIASHLAGAEPISEVRGVVKSRYFFRTSAGAGWALIGDAGHHKEFVVGLGISDALRDARSLADAVLDGRSAALQRYWRRRDAERIELFHWSRDQGAADSVDSLERLMAERAPRHPKVLPRLAAVLDGELAPYKFIPPQLAFRWVGSELLRGRASAIRPLLRTARRTMQTRRQSRSYQSPYQEAPATSRRTKLAAAAAATARKYAVSVNRATTTD